MNPFQTGVDFTDTTYDEVWGGARGSGGGARRSHTPPPGGWGRTGERDDGARILHKTKK